MKRSCFALAALAAVILCAGAAWAQAAQPAPGAQASLKARLKVWAAGQDWAGESSYGFFFPDQAAYRKIFGSDWLPLIRFGGYWYPLEDLSVGFVIGGMYDRGFALGTISGKTSGERIELWVVPVQFNVRYRFQWLPDQVVVPAVWAGLDWWWFREDNDSSADVEGDKAGYHLGVDVAFLLDPLEPDAAHHLRMDYGIDNTYLCLGYEWLSVGEAEDGLRFTGPVYTLGLRLEMVGHPDEP